MKQLRNSLLQGIFISTVVAVTNIYSVSVHAGQQSTTGAMLEPVQHQDIINNKIAFYKKKFKDIHFVHLNGGSDWRTELSNVLNLLGDNALALDYEHPTDLQQDVMNVTIERIRLMLEYDLTSATLFGVGEDGDIEHSRLCVVTLNTQAAVANDIEALSYMLGYKEDVINKIDPSRYLDIQDQLEFLLDHEFFHCLDSYIYGGVPMTFEKMGGEYNQFRGENSADAFALGMHLKEYGEMTDFARNIVHIRALTMFNNSPGHHTFETIKKIARLDINKLKAMSIMELIALSKDMVDKTVSSYHDYIVQQAAELRAARVLGIEPSLSDEAYLELENIEVSQQEIDRVVEHFRYFYTHLFTDSAMDLNIDRLH